MKQPSNTREAAPPANVLALSDADLLDCLGPSWSAMTPEQRRLYAGPITLAGEAADSADALAVGDRGTTLAEAGELVELAVRFPEGVYEYGLEPVARACLADPCIVDLAARLDRYVRDGEDDAYSDDESPSTDARPLTDADRAALGAQHLLAAIGERNAA